MALLSINFRRGPTSLPISISKTSSASAAYCGSTRSKRRFSGFLKEKNNTLVQEVQSAQHGREELERENSQLKEQQQGWQERLQALLGRMEEV